MPPLWFDTDTLFYASEWVIRLGALAIIPLRRSPAAARGWLLLIFFLPWAGLFLFWMIGSPKFPEWRMERFHRLRPFFAETAESQRPFAAHLGDATPIADLAETLGQMPATGGNHLDLIDDYEGLIDRLIADIDGATRSVHILVYIFADDATGRRVIDALGGAVRRGVDVRVMVDPVGSYRWWRNTDRLLRTRGVHVREALPFRFIRGRTRRDMRNHRKLFVIDGCVGYAGSQNIVDPEFRPGIYNHELVARVTGPVVASMDALVRGDWNMETGDYPTHSPITPEPLANARVQLLPSGAAYPLEGFQTLLVWQIHQAQSHVIIATPYFIPDDDVLGAMAAAVARGVHVDLVVSEVVDQPLVHLSQSSFYADLLDAGVHINLYPRHLLHAKNLSIDDRLAIVGSSNVDIRSFQLNEEASLLLYDADSIARVKAIQQGYLDVSTRLRSDEWAQRPFHRRMLENGARLVNSLL
ncbi:MAG: cardiolipin synthase [Sphingobium sp.]|nr:cardiolipin synthase [Sphingobium sp.]